MFVWHSEPSDQVVLLSALLEPPLCLLLSPWSEFRQEKSLRKSWLIFVYRWIRIPATTAWKIFRRRRQSWGRISVTAASTVHRAKRRYHLVRHKFRCQWLPRKAKNRPKARKWSRRRCITWRAWPADGLPGTLASATRRRRYVPGQSKNTSIILASRCCLSTSRLSYCMTSRRSKTFCAERRRSLRSFQAWL